MSAPEIKAYHSSRWAAWLAPKRLSALAGLEVAGLMLLLMLLCLWLQPADPFLLQRSFPWLWLGPLLLSLRYGTLAAFGACALLAAFWFLLPAVGFANSANGIFPEGFFLGGIITCLLAGEFSDVWGTRLRRVSEVNAYLNERLASLTRRHYLLRLSHERLEQELLVKPMTLRDALQRLRKLLVDDGGAHPLPEAQQFLHLLSQSCQLEVACLHVMEDEQPLPVPVASIGETSEFDGGDLLVRYALEHSTLAHVQTEGLQAESSRYLVVAPVADSAGSVHGLLVVERLPFLSLNEETLRFLAVLIGYYADGVTLGPASTQIVQAVPACPPLFAGELVRLHRIRVEAGIQSTVAALVIAPGLRQSEIALETLRQSRQLDVIWDFEQDGYRCIFTIMPLHGEAAMSGYLLRTERWLRDVLGLQDFAAADLMSHTALIGTAAPHELLQDLLQRCHRAGQ